MSNQPIPDPQQIPTPDELTTPFIDALVARRPNALGPINSDVSRWNDIIYGVKAETRLLRARLVDEAIAARLPLATGHALLELARSEYWVDADVGPKVAIGGVILQRTVTNTNGSPTNNFPHGIILRGTQFRKVGDPTVSPPIPAANYVVTTPLVASTDDTLPVTDNHDGTFTHVQRMIAAIACDRAGAHANTPLFVDTAGNFTEFPTLQFFDKAALFDQSFTIVLGGGSGGSDGISDPALRMLAQANYTGQFAPTDGALLAGALDGTGAEHVAVVEDPTTATTKVFVTDASWGASGPYLTTVEQLLKDDWMGFGCALKVLPVYNQRISVAATVTLVDPKFLSDPTEIIANVGKALRSYFDDRRDWYTWRLNAIGGTIIAADRRVLTVSNVTVKDSTGTPLAEPPATIASTATFGRHFYLTDNATALAIEGPVVP